MRNATVSNGRREERGAAMIVVIVSVLVAAFISLALVVVATSRNRAVESRRAMESALSVAEAGLARGLSEANLPANRQSKTWPPVGLAIKAAPQNEVRDALDTTKIMGHFVVEFFRGDQDGQDNDGNGMTDEINEKRFVIIESTGYHGTNISPSNAWK